MLIELNEGTAARRRIPVRLFTSDGTSPDTGASNDSLYMGTNSALTFTLSDPLAAVHAAAGMYYCEMTQSECSVLGVHPIYHTQGDFAQHVANIEIVNSNPYSTESHGAYLQPTTAGRTLDVTATGAAGVDWGNVENQSTAVDLSATDIQLVDTATAVTNAVTVGTNNDKTGYALSAAGRNLVAVDSAQSVWNTGVAGYTSTTSFGGALSRFSSSDDSVGLKAVNHPGATVPTVTDVTNAVTVGTNNDKTGYTLTAAERNLIAVDSADSVWDEAMSDHRVLGSFGLAAQIASAGSRTDGASTSVITLGSGETTTNDFYNGAILNVMYDDGSMAAGVIDDYTGSDQSVSLRDPLPLAPSAATYWIFQAPVSGATVDSVLTVQAIAGTKNQLDDLNDFNASTTSVGLKAANHPGATVPTVTDVTNAVTVGTNNDKTGYTLTAAGRNLVAVDSAQSVWNTGVAGYTSTDSFGGALSRFSSSGDSVGLKAANHPGATVPTVTDVTNGVSIANGAITSSTFGAGAIDAAALATDAGQEIADRLVLRRVKGGADSGRTIGEAFAALRNRVQVSDTSFIVYDDDDTTVLWHASIQTTATSVFLTDANPDA